MGATLRSRKPENGGCLPEPPFRLSKIPPSKRDNNFSSC